MFGDAAPDCDALTGGMIDAAEELEPGGTSVAVPNALSWPEPRAVPELAPGDDAEGKGEVDAGAENGESALLLKSIGLVADDSDAACEGSRGAWARLG